jgi:hypothetical protein
MRFHSLAVHAILFIAVSIHGMTPDANDLASLQGLLLLCQVSTGLASTPDDADDADVPQEDDVCGALGRATSSELSEILERLKNSVASSSISPTQLIDPSASGSLVNDGHRAPRDDLSCLLCRMHC